MKVLVYGTLKRNHGNNSLLSDARLIKSDTFEIENCTLRADPSSPFPYLYKGDKTCEFIGEMYEIDSETLKDLDALEGHPSFYTREYIKKYDCFTYVFTHDDAEDFDIIKNFGEAS